MNINQAITQLVEYAIEKELVSECDRVYSVNRLLEILKIDEYQFEQSDKLPLCELLKVFCDYAVQMGMIEDTVTFRDLFDTKIMGAVTQCPSQIIYKFNKLYKESPERATEFYYNFSKNSNYVRADRIARDRKWVTDTKFGPLDITINLSKPEKDPKQIAAAKNAKQSGYPKCALCRENEGYSGRINAAARQNHRIIPIKINDSEWGFQYSPYVYYNEHCIVFNFMHTPMKIERATFVKLFDFIKLFPHYFLGSNADLPIVGGSILSHDHFQGGNYNFAMAKAPIEKRITFSGFDDIEAGIVRWPLSVIRLRSKSSDRIIELASKILLSWRSYTDEEAFVFAETNGVKHNTITPIARKNGAFFELDLVLRNNITTEEHPLGVYHPHAQYHHIKKENIGLIEVMGLAVLPARLNDELDEVARILVSGEKIPKEGSIEKHAEWVNQIRAKYSEINKNNVEKIIHDEVGLVFEKVLECAGVYKCTAQGRKFFERFINSVQ